MNQTNASCGWTGCKCLQDGQETVLEWQQTIMLVNFIGLHTDLTHKMIKIYSITFHLSQNYFHLLGLSAELPQSNSSISFTPGFNKDAPFSKRTG